MADLKQPATDAVPPPRLTDFIERPVLTQLQAAFTELTGVTVQIRDGDGEALTEPCGKNDFCRHLESHATSAVACRRSHLDATDAARAAAGPQRTECHAGLIQIAAPIRINDRFAGAILIGERPASPLTEDNVRTLAEQHGLEYEAARRMAWSLPNWSERQMVAAGRFAGAFADALGRLGSQEMELRQRVDELTAVYKVSALLTGDRSLDEILKLSAKLVTEVLHVKAAGIRLLDPDTGELKVRAVYNLSDGYLAKGPLLVGLSAIDSEAMAGKLVYVENMPTDPRTVYQAQAQAEGIVSALVTSLTYRGKSIGVMRVYSGERRVFTRLDAALLTAVAGQCAAAIIHARMRRQAREAEELDRQVRLAGEVQRRMIPAEPPRRPRLDVGSVYQPNFELGGDFFDFLELGDGHLGVAIADVVGKGLPASLTMASVRASLRAHARNIYDIDRIIVELNRQLCRDTRPNEFTTLFYGVIDEKTLRLTYCNAGHEPLVRLRADLQIEVLNTGGPIIGVDPDAAYDRGIVDLASGDVLLLMTDGVLEALNEEGQTYGRQRLYDALRKNARLAAGAMANQILFDVRKFVGLTRQSDDITLVTVKVR